MTERTRVRCIRSMGVLRSPHEATCPSIASRFSRGRSHVILYLHISDKLSRLIGTAHTPALIDVRIDEDFDADPRLIPGAVRRSHRDTHEWAAQLTGRPVIVICHKGQKLSEGAAAWLRHSGVAAEILEGGFVGWQQAKLPTVPAAKIPARDGRGRTVWVTRSRPKIDRIACPWLIRRFIDPSCGIPVRRSFRSRSRGRAIQRHAVRYRKRVLEPSRRTLHLRCHDRGVRSGDAALAAAGDDGARGRYRPARSVAGSAGLLAASLGLSRMYDDDLEQLDAGMLLYDAFYRWCRDATGETHNWPANKAKP